jgi:hypothetical protein
MSASSGSSWLATAPEEDPRPPLCYLWTVHDVALALEPEAYRRSIDASRDTLGKPRVKLLEIVEHVRELTGDAPYAVIGGLAQILWARKTHTDDLDVALSAERLEGVRHAIEGGLAKWSLPDRGAHEQDSVFEVLHALFDGSVVDLIRFKNVEFNRAILDTAIAVPELGGTRFVRPELLLVTHVLRPGPNAALAAVELVISRREAGGFDEEASQKWAATLGKSERLERVLEQAAALSVL